MAFRVAIVVAALLLLALPSACEKRKADPIKAVETTPAPSRNGKPGGAIRVNADAGATVRVALVKHIDYKDEKFVFKWTSSGPCKGTFDRDDNFKIEYTIPEDCKGGTDVLTVDVTTSSGTVKRTVEVEVKPKKAVVGLTPTVPDPIPGSWDILNDYDGPIADKNLRKNRREAFFGTWTYRDGKCILSEYAEQKGVMEILFKLPFDDLSACGYFEYFKGTEEGKAEVADLSGYLKVGIIVKSADGQKHQLRVELVEFDKYAPYNQGIVGTSDPIIVDGEWRRHEVFVRHLAEGWNAASVKTLGLKIDRKDGNAAEGRVLVDKLYLLRVEE